uniref:ISXO2-like transposase domain-containing protein n=1 Tax=Tetranychus urticae TaxID=32264 RepID=A0A158P4I5_TETUR
MIGGTGRIVEIDETMVFKRKYNRGRLSSEQKRQVWVFGGIDRESKETFAKIVEKRDEATLLEVIKRNILPGTTIYSDGWRSYNNLNQHNYYLHDSVNHSENFLNPSNKSVHTQTIERNWRSLKNNIPKSSHGPKKDDYLIEFLYKSRYHTKNEPALNFEITLKHLQNNPFSLDQLDVFDYNA